MNVSKFKSILSNTIDVFLAEQGFSVKEAMLYSRDSVEGFDLIQLDYCAKKKNISVLMSFFPKYLEELFVIYARENEELGFPVGPFLNKVMVSSDPRYWSCKTEESAASSVSLIMEALKSTGLPWLEKLRDKKFYAGSVDKMALGYYGLANECAGNIDIAHDTYLRIIDRGRVMIDKYGISDGLIDEMGEEFLFACEKLNVEDGYAELIVQRVNK